MIFKTTKLKGAYLIEIESKKDKRGFFARTFCQRDFKKQGLSFDIVQSSISYNKEKGTLRGMHYQITPYGEEKLVSCLRGAIYDVIIDLRKNSPTYYQWLAVELTSQNNRMLYIPKGFAHGFQTLVDNSEIFYQMSEYYNPDSSRGFRFDDPTIDISWPTKLTVISQKDKELPLFENIQISDLSKNT